jgi:hypothetical protein
VNNTNWSTMLKNYVECSAIESIAHQLAILGSLRIFTMTITPTGVAAHNVDGSSSDILSLNLLLANGGTCRYSGVGGIAGTKLVTVPAFNLPTTGPGITADISAMVGAAVAAKIDKITWVGYYDISPATIDIAAALSMWAPTPALGTWFQSQWAAFGLPASFPLSRNATQTATFQRDETDLSTAICKGVAAGAAGAPAGTASCTTWQTPGFAASTDIQSTVVGGMPHPSAAGHAKLTALLIPRV